MVRWLWWLSPIAAVLLAYKGNLDFASSGLLSRGLPWWVAGLAVLTTAALIGDRRHPRPPRVDPWRGVDTGAALSIVLVALAFRLWRITQYPPSDLFGFEEFQTGGLAFNLLRHGTFPFEFPLTNALPAVTFWLFGFSSYSLRLPFIVSGVVAPLFLFLALRRLVAWPAAWASAMCLASARWPAAAARFADEIFFPLSVMAASLWLLVRAVQRRSLFGAVVFGVVSGDLFYAYTGYRIFPLIGWACVAAAAVAARARGTSPHSAARGLVLVAATWAVVLAPGIAASGGSASTLFFEAFQRHAEVRQHTGAEAGLGQTIGELAGRAWQGARIFLIQGDDTPTVNIPFDPMLDPITAALAALAVVAAVVWGWRNPWRTSILAAFAIPFAGLCLVPTNLNVQRYFVLLVPLFALIGFLLDDMLRWRPALAPWVRRALVLLVAAVGLTNGVWMQRMIDEPRVRDSFLYPENTVLAAIHGAAPGARLVLLTIEGSNSFEPSDYNFYVQHLTGARPATLAEALAVSVSETQPIYWIAQGTPEAETLPQLVALVCPDAQARLNSAPGPAAVVGIVSVTSPERCVAPAAHGLRACYQAHTTTGKQQARAQIDPVLFSYTVPWKWEWPPESGELAKFEAGWSGEVRPPQSGAHVFELELRGARGRLRVGSAEVVVAKPSDDWQAHRLEVHLDRPAPLRVEAAAEGGRLPSVRLWWQPPGGEREIVPPRHLHPSERTQPCGSDG